VIFQNRKIVSVLTKERFEDSTVVKIQDGVFWIVTSCDDVIWYWNFGWPYYSVFRTSPWKWRQHGPPKRWYTTSLHDVTIQKKKS